MNVRHSSHVNGPSQQRGIATILVVLLVGVAMTATSLGIMHSMRSVQEKHLAVHASTHAQSGVWAGAEAFRRYLGAIDTTTLTGLDQNNEYPIEFGVAGSDHYGSLAAKNVTVTEVDGKYRVSADIINIHAQARSSSALGLMYEIDPNAGGGSVELTNSLDFHDDLNVTGKILFPGPDGAKPTLNVDGNLAITSAQTTGFEQLNATGNVTLNSGIESESIYSNGDVILSQSAWADKVEAVGTVTTSGGGGAGNIWANGKVTMGASTPSTAANSRTEIEVTVGAHGLLKAGGDVTVKGSASGTYGKIMATGDIAISTWITVDEIIGEGALTCTSKDWKTVGSISVTEANINSDTCSNEIPRTSQPPIVVMSEVQPFVMPPLIIDVWALKSKANYVIEWDDVVRREKITVQNVSNLADGSVFYLGDYASAHKSYLCTEFTNDGLCSAPTTPSAAICMGHSVYNTCLSYNRGTKTWTFDGSGTAPGIIWVDGNVQLNSGSNHSTILATGNIATGGSLRVQAANHGAFAEMCQINAGLFPETDKGQEARVAFQEIFIDQYPTNLCGESTYLPIPTGNIGLAAGSFDPEGDNTFSGGNIDLGASTTIYGTVLAGNFLKTSGDTKIYGYVTAAVQGDKSADDNLLGASTTVDLTHASDTYDPKTVPSTSAPPCTIGCAPGEYGEKAKLLWSKYL